MASQLAAAALVIILSGWGATMAQAACGDWLADHGNASAAESRTARDHHESSPVNIPTCNGPACGKSPLAPPSAPQGKDVGTDKSGLGFAGLPFDAARSPRDYGHPQDDPHRADGFSPSLKRPPRF